MHFAQWLVFIVTAQEGFSVTLTANDIKNIFKAKMNKRTFESTKDLHLNWYTYAIKALLGQVGKQMYKQLTEDKQKMLAACLDQIEGDNELVAGAKCFVQARRETDFSFLKQNFVHDRAANKSADIPAFIISDDSEEKDSLRNHDYEGKNSDWMSTNGKIRRYEFLNEFSKQYPFGVLTKFLEYSSISHLKQVKKFTSQNFNISRHFTGTLPVSASPNHQKSQIIYTHPSLLSIDKKSNVYLISRKNSTGKDKNSEILYSIENEIKRAAKLAHQSSNSHYFEEVRNTKSEQKQSEKSDLFKKKNLPTRPKNFRKRDGYFAVPGSSSKQGKKFFPNFTQSKFRKKKLKRRRRSYRLISNRVMKSDRLIVDVKQLAKMPAMRYSTMKKTLIQQMSKFISVMLSGKEVNGNWTKTYERITEFKKEMGWKLKPNNARVYNSRLFDLVLDNKKPTRPKVQSKYEDFISMATNLVNGISRKGKNKDLNFRFLSPRIMPLLPDKMQYGKRILSPSILPFYKNDSPESIISLPKLLEKSGMEEKDREAVLEMVMHVSGARLAIEMALDMLNETNVLDDLIFETTKRIHQAFKDLEKSFSVEQKNEMKSRGFTFLEASQLKEILHQHGVKRLKDVNFDLEKYEKLNKKEQEEILWKSIERIAENKTEERYRRKRQTIPESPNTILAPFMFSPVFGLSILGPVVLSPSIFSPLILNPSIFGPYVLSPGVFLPFLLSPYILSPYVLSPLVGAPYILSPYILSPNVINPYVLSPLVLSPYILSPDILSPQILGGQILSPNVFSPSIYTDSVLTVSVLSPSWMSK